MGGAGDIEHDPTLFLEVPPSHEVNDYHTTSAKPVRCEVDGVVTLAKRAFAIRALSVRAIVAAVAIAVTVAQAAHAQPTPPLQGTPAPPPAPQQASPMQEGIRRHERLTQRALPGTVVPLTLHNEAKGELYLSRAARGKRAVDVLVHFHGAAWLAQQAGESLGRPLAVVTLTLGSGSGVYDRTFRQPGMMDSLMARTEGLIDSLAAKRVTPGRLFLSGFSAGHGAVRVILRDSVWMSRVTGVLLMDGMHTSYVPEGVPLASGGALDTVNLLSLTAYARRAASGDQRMVVTHSEIFPGTFASTTETAAWMLQSLGVPERPVLEWGPRGLQQISEAKRGRLLVMGFAGNSAPDHVDHFHAMPELLKALFRR